MPYGYAQMRLSGDDRRREPEDESVFRSQLYLVFLTISIGGLQVVWATVFAHGSTYLISLGLQTPVVSLVWVAGPICGIFVQPYIGYKSDFCQHSWGRRRPFMIYGTISTIVCINALSWTSETVRLVCNILKLPGHDVGAKLATQALAIFGVWALNFAIQPVQASIRALIVDACPGGQATQANSFASFATIIGSAIGYGCGFIEIPKGPEWVHNSEFKVLCLIASISLGATVAITSFMIEEKPVDVHSDRAFEKIGVRKIWGEISKDIRTLPSPMKRICAVQFFAWLGWFPFLFNIVLYLSRLYEVQTLSTKMGPPSTRFYNALREQSTRHAVLSMVVFSIVALISNVCLPYLVTNLISLSASESRCEQSTSQKSGVSLPWGKGIRTFLTLPRLWMISHIVTACALFGATLGDSFMTSVFCVSLLGISWTVTQWAPFAIISAEIALSSSAVTSSSLPDPDEFDKELENQSDISEKSDLGGRAGTTMAIHNIAIALPQVFSAVVAALIFWGCRQLSIGETDAMRWVLRVGVLAGGCAAWCARKVR